MNKYEIKNHGIDLDKELKEQDPRDWEHSLGAERKCLSEQLKKPLKTYAPIGETQRGKEDFMDCASRSPVNDSETKDTGLVLEGVYSEGNIKWLKDNGYWNEEKQKIEYSDRFIARLSGTTRRGNSLKAPLEAIRKYGMIPKKMFPAEEWMTWDDYHIKEEITQKMLALGQEWLRRFGYNYEKVFDLLHFRDLVGVVGHAWPTPDENGIYQRVEHRFNHAFLKYPDLPPSLIFDNYPDTFDGDYWKQLAEDYKLMRYGYRSIRSEKWSEPIKPKKKFMINLIQFDTLDEVYLQSNINPKEILWIGNERTFKLFKRMGWIGDWSDIDKINVALKPSYKIIKGVVIVNYLLNVVVNWLGFSKKIKK